MKVKPSLEEVLAVSVAVYEKNEGYLKKFSGDVMRGDKKSNATLIYEHFLTPKTKRNLLITDEHRKTAEEIIRGFSDLFIKALKGNLTSFESQVMKLLKCNKGVSKKLIGTSAPLPLIHINNTAKDIWKEKRKDLAETSKPIGVKNHAETLKGVTIEYIKLATSDMRQVYVAGTTKDNNIVEFRSAYRYGWGTRIKINDTINMKCIISMHERDTTDNSIINVLEDVVLF